MNVFISFLFTFTETPVYKGIELFQHLTLLNFFLFNYGKKKD